MEIKIEITLDSLLLRKVDDLNLSVRAGCAFANYKIIYLGDLVRKSEKELLQMQNFGRVSLNEVKQKLAQLGLHLGTEVRGWPPDYLEELAKRFEDYY